MSKYLDNFSELVRKQSNRKYCLPVSHGTAALHLSMLALEIGPGDEVIVPDITWVASASCAKYVGAKLRFADIDPKTWCICPKSAAKLINKKTKAIMVVNLFGTMAPIDELLALCRKHSIALVEDAAESLGATYKSKPSGSFGDISILSFNATKLAMAGQGGALLTDNLELFKRAQLYSAHGIDKSINGRYYWSHVLGYNYRWTNIQAALAISQLSRLPKLLAYKLRVFGWYREFLNKESNICLNHVPRNTTASYWQVVAELKNGYAINKEIVESEMKKYGTDIRPFFYPLSSMPPFQADVKGLNMRKQNPVTYDVSERAICLPSSFAMKKADVKYVCEKLIQTLKRLSK
jgi:perosamine synthetase